MRTDRERLQDILEAISRIERYASGGREQFNHDELVQIWIIHHIQIIGEAARHLSEGFRERHGEIPWSEIIGMRNILVHDYFGLDLEEVWATVERDFPNLKRRIAVVLQGLSAVEDRRGMKKGP